MARKTPPNHGKAWTPAAEKQFREQVRQNTPTRVIALKQGRTPDAIYNKASELDLSLKPTNQSPYNRRGKR
jgi:hypothetical protein